MTSTKISPSLNCIPLPIFYVLHVTAVLFISNGTSVRPSAAPPSVRPRPSVRSSVGRVRGKDPALPCPCNRRRRRRRARRARRRRAPPERREQEKKETILSKAILSGADARARTDGRTDARTWEAPHRDIGGHRTNARMQIVHERVVEVANGTLEWGEF